MPADPTMTLLNRFHDESAWDHIDRGVPIFKPHVGTHFNPTTQKRDLVVDYTVERLERMVKTNAERCLNSACVPVMVLKHDDEDPEIVGYWTNLRMGTFGPSQKPAMLADRYFLPGTYEKSKKFPFRSVEFYPAEYCEAMKDRAQPEDYDAIKAVALLKTDPKLDMGTTVYARSFPVCYAMGGEDNVDPATIPGVPPPPGATPPAAPGAPPGQVGATSTPNDQIYQEFKPHFQRCMAEMFPGMDKFYQADVAPKYGASAMAAPSAMNGGPPAPAGPPTAPPEGGAKEKPPFPPSKGDDKKETPKPEKEKMSTPLAPEQPAPLAPDVAKQHADQRAIEAERYRADLKIRDDRLAALEADRLNDKREVFLAKYEKDLGVLVGMGKDLVLADEIVDCREAISTNADPAAWGKWSEKTLNKIKSRYGSILTNPHLGSINGDRIISDSRLNPPPSPEKALLEYSAERDGMAVVHYQESLGWNHGQYERAKQAVLKAKPEALKAQKEHPEWSWEQCLFSVLPKN